MNDALLQRWNEVVKPKDTIWVLGDFTFRHAKGSVLPFYSQLNGVKHLVRGNHDNAEVLGLPWESVSDYKELNIDGKKLVLSHYPMRSWNGMYRGSIHLYGHEHGNLEDFNNCCDVGVDSWNFYPTSLPQVLDRIGNLPTRGTTPDRRMRGALWYDARGIGIMCYNCNYKTRFKMGDLLGKNMKDFLSKIGVGDIEIQKLNYWAFTLRSLAEASEVVQEKILTTPSFQSKPLPPGARSIEDWANDNCNDPDFVRAVEYIYGRGDAIAEATTYYWTPDTKNNMNKRIIIPCLYEGMLVGWSGRSTVDIITPKYFNNTPPNFLFNSSALTNPNRKIVIIVEGMLDALALDCVALLGVKLNERQAAWINSSGKEIIVLPDRDGAAFARCRTIIDEDYFDDRLRPAVRFVIDYADEFKKLPAIEQVKAKSGVSVEKFSEGALHTDSLLKEVEKFCQYKAMELCVLDSVELLQTGRAGEIVERAKAALTISLMSELGTDYFVDPKARLERMKDKSAYVSTGWKLLDDKLYGGFTRGGLNIFCGQSGCVVAGTKVRIIRVKPI
ncbi:unnamed protein product [Sphagnum tenellum]